MFDDNWGCVEPSELFSSAGKTQSLSYLVEQLQQGTSAGSSGYDGLVDADRQRFPIASTSSDTSSTSFADVPVITNGVRPQQSAVGGRPPMAPKILKQKRGLVERPPSLKRVTFEVERFVVDNIADAGERKSAETQLAVRLGAKPERRLATNYKVLVAEKTADRVEAAKTAANGLELEQMSAAATLVKLVADKKKKTAAGKTKNGKIVKSAGGDATAKRKK